MTNETSKKDPEKLEKDNGLPPQQPDEPHQRGENAFAASSQDSTRKLSKFDYGGNIPKVYQCQTCALTFSRSQSLANHTKKCGKADLSRSSRAKVVEDNPINETGSVMIQLQKKDQGKLFILGLI